MTIMLAANTDTARRIAESYSLEAQVRRADLKQLAERLGVVSVEESAIASDAMLLPVGGGFKIVLKAASTPGAVVRQRFSFAHELGHLLLCLSGYTNDLHSDAKYRNSDKQSKEERLCDQIAAEILMPRSLFTQDLARRGAGLASLSGLARAYETSILATAKRIVDLTPETVIMGVWRQAGSPTARYALEWAYSRSRRYGVPSPSRTPRRRLWLIGRSDNSQNIETGIAPLVDRVRQRALPEDVPAEAWAWGQTQHRKVMVYYYPDRELSGEMAAIANAIGRVSP